MTRKKISSVQMNEHQCRSVDLAESLGALKPSPSEKKGVFHFTGIGSTPFHDRRRALDYAFKHSIPFLPELPQLIPSERMIAQVIHRFYPGDLHSLPLSLPISLSPSSFLDQKTTPSPRVICWEPFLERLKLERPSRAKIQLPGPITCSEILRKSLLIDSFIPLGNEREVLAEICARLKTDAEQMSRSIQERGVKPLVFFDEPCLFLPRSGMNPEEEMNLFKVLIQELQSKRIDVGIHCCGVIHWPTVINLKPRWISFDVELSGPSFFQEIKHPKNQPLFQDWVHSGGRLCPGFLSPHRVEPTSLSPHSQTPHSFFDAILKNEVLAFTERLRSIGDELQLPAIESLIKDLILSTSCGLAHHTPSDARLILQALQAVSMGLN